MLLHEKVAIIYGAGGPIGSAVARAFVREGARLFLSARQRAKLDPLVEELVGAGAEVEAESVDALDESAVEAYVDTVAARAGRVDISFNAIGYCDVQQPLAEISVHDFLQPIINATRSQFLTSRAAVRHMTTTGGGVILIFGGDGPQTVPGLGGFKIALDALEGLRRQFSIEFGRQGVRFVTLKSGGIPETLADSFSQKEQIVEQISEATLLGRAATLEDVGNVAAFAASDHARAITSTFINISSGAMVD